MKNKFHSLLILFYFLAILSAGCTHSPNRQKEEIKKRSGEFSIVFLPYQNFDSSLLQLAAKEVAIFYQCNVTILASKDLPANAFYATRQRYKADSLLSFQKNLADEKIVSVVSLTEKDISTSKGAIKDWGVFGLGYCPGKACVISAYRLRKASKTRQQLEERLVKVVLHELGHNLGLPHCINDTTCLMNDAAGSIRQADKEKKWLCTHCRKQLSK